MDDTNFKLKKGIYIAIGYLLLAFGILLLILGLTLDVSIKNVLIIISVILIVGAIGYYFLSVKMINNLKNRFKELIISDAFTSKNFLYFSRQLGIDDKNKYAFSKEEYESLNYFKANDELKFMRNELVVGQIRSIDFRSMDYKFITEMKKTTKSGRIYSLNLKSNKDFTLLITKNNETTSLKKMDLRYGNYNFYTNNIDMANKYINGEKFGEKILKLEHYSPVFMKVFNGSVYVILDNLGNSFEIENRTYNDITEDVEKEMLIISTIIDCFNFEAPKPKIKPLKIK